jgi:hypothetical protein
MIFVLFSDLPHSQLNSTIHSLLSIGIVLHSSPHDQSSNLDMSTINTPTRTAISDSTQHRALLVAKITDSGATGSELIYNTIDRTAARVSSTNRLCQRLQHAAMAWRWRWTPPSCRGKPLSREATGARRNRRFLRFRRSSRGTNANFYQIVTRHERMINWREI